MSYENNVKQNFGKLENIVLGTPVMNCQVKKNSVVQSTACLIQPNVA